MDFNESWYIAEVMNTPNFSFLMVCQIYLFHRICEKNKVLYKIHKKRFFTKC